METKNEKFLRLSEQRATKAVGFINSLKKLMAPAYESTLENRATVIDALDTALSDLRQSYGVTNGSADITKTDIATNQPTRAEDEALFLIRNGNTIDGAINALTDGKPDEAREILMNLMSA